MLAQGPTCVEDPENCTPIDLGTYQTWIHAEGLLTAPLSNQYVASIYWAFATMSTAGYGDVSAVNNTERVTSILCMVFGVTIFGYTLLRVSFVLIDGDPREAARKAKKEQVRPSCTRVLTGGAHVLFMVDRSSVVAGRDNSTQHRFMTKSRKDSWKDSWWWSKVVVVATMVVSPPHRVAAVNNSTGRRARLVSHPRRFWSS